MVNGQPHAPAAFNAWGNEFSVPCVQGLKNGLQNLFAYVA
jgi:hypothetical protein